MWVVGVGPEHLAETEISGIVIAERELLVEVVADLSSMNIPVRRSGACPWPRSTPHRTGEAEHERALLFRLFLRLLVLELRTKFADVGGRFAGGRARIHGGALCCDQGEIKGLVSDCCLHRFGLEVNVIQDFAGCARAPPFQNLKQDGFILHVHERAARFHALARLVERRVVLRRVGTLFGKIPVSQQPAQSRIVFRSPRPKVEKLPPESGERASVLAVVLHVK